MVAVHLARVEVELVKPKARADEEHDNKHKPIAPRKRWAQVYRSRDERRHKRSHAHPHAITPSARKVLPPNSANATAAASSATIKPTKRHDP